MKDVQDLDAWLDHVSEQVQRNVQIVTPVEVGQDFFLHISADTSLRNYLPCVPKRQAKGEERTLPRVTVAPTLLGCFIGYAASEYDFLYAKHKDVENPRWRGGWVINALPFKAALRPNAKMVYDQAKSDEHWLVAYNDDTSEYIPTPVGKAFYRSVRYVAVAGDQPDTEGTLFLEVSKEDGFQFSKNIRLDAGYYSIEGPLAKDITSWLTDSAFVVQPITQEEFNSAKRAMTDLQHYKEPRPAYMAW